MAQNKSNLPVLGGIVAALLVLVGLFVALRIDTTGSRGSGLGEEFTYSVSAWSRTDPARIGYREVANRETGFQEVRALAVGPGDALYVAGDSSVRVFDNPRLTNVPLEEAAACLAVGPDGRLYAGRRDRIETFDRLGKRIADWRLPATNAWLTALAVASNRIFAADAVNREILCLDPQGAVVWRTGGFIVPSPYFDLALAADGTLKAVDPGRHQVQTYALDGTLQSRWGKASFGIEGFSGCCNPAHIALTADGKVVTSEKGIPRVKIYEADGVFTTVVAGPEAFRGVKPESGGSASGAAETECAPSDIAVDSAGRVLALDPRTRTVRVFEKKEATHAAPRK
jgi:hypothetical protein